MTPESLRQQIKTEILAFKVVQVGSVPEVNAFELTKTLDRIMRLLAARQTALLEDIRKNGTYLKKDSGFAYAADQVFGDVTHIFCDYDLFCQQVLKKHWPEAKIYGDIRKIDTNPFDTGLEGRKQEPAVRHGRQSGGERQDETSRPFILTGGFPCQPFSAAGLRRGTADERHLWPEMLRVIRLTQPEWVIAENVRGILTWNEGMVFEQVCTDLETAGYEVQAFVIPAVAVNAPHRRDRVWFVANRRRQHGRSGSSRSASGQKAERSAATEKAARLRHFDWNDDWTEVAAELCGVDDGLPVRVGGLELTKPQHRKEQLKAYGNAIVPQVAMQIMTAIGGQKGRI